MDFFAESADFVVRYQGGNNAGHTIVVGEQRLALSMIPSGILYPDCVPVIASGTVIDPRVLIAEMDMAAEKNLDPSRVRVSSNAHLIMPYHRKLDAAIERYLGKNQIGTTKKGIGPAYTDKYARFGIRVQDLFDPKIFREKVEAALVEKNKVLPRVYNTLPMDPSDHRGIRRVRRTPRTPRHRHLAAPLGRPPGRQAGPFEGAQGTLLDHRPRHISLRHLLQSHRRWGVGRVGHRPQGDRRDHRGGQGLYLTSWDRALPELRDEVGERMIELGGEYGTVTGRRRRCGWLDLVALKYACRVNTFTSLFLTKMDILSAFDTIKVATAYTSQGERHEISRPSRASSITVSRNTTSYRVAEDITGVRAYGDLPSAARAYIEYIQEAVEVPVGWVSVGPERSQLIEIS